MMKNIIRSINGMAKKVAGKTEQPTETKLDIVRLNHFNVRAYDTVVDSKGAVVIRFSQRGSRDTYDEITLRLKPEDAEIIADKFCRIYVGSEIETRISSINAIAESSVMIKGPGEKAYAQDVVMIDGMGVVNIYNGRNGNVMAISIYEPMAANYDSRNKIQYVFDVRSNDPEKRETLSIAIAKAAKAAKAKCSGSSK